MNSLKRISIAFLILITSSFTLSASSPRNVLIEEFTNASNAPDAAQNPSFQQYLFSNVSNSVIPLIYHIDYVNGDFVTVADTAMHRGRSNYYSLTSAPFVKVNGITTTASSTSFTDGTAGDTTAVNNGVKNYDAETSPYSISVTQTNQTDGSIKIDVHVGSDIAINGKKYLRVAVAEGYHFYKYGAGTNGETDFYYTARGMFPNSTGTQLNIAAGGGQDFSFSYKPAEDIFRKSVYAVAFIQDDNSKEILQAAASTIPNMKNATNLPKVEPGITMNNAYSKIPAGTTTAYDVTISNPTNSPLTVDLSVTRTFVPAAWQIAFEQSRVQIPANGNIVAKLKITPDANAGYGLIGINAQPIYIYDSIEVFNTVNSGKLTENTKYLFSTGVDSYNYLIYTSVNNYLNTDKNKMALIFMDNDFVNSFDFSDYDLLVTTLDSPNSYFAAQSNSYTNQIVYQIKSMIDKGKKLFMTAELYASSCFATNNTNSVGQDFLKNYIGITSPGSFSLLNTSNQLLTLPLSGTSDFMANGISSVINQNYSGTVFPYLCQYADALSIQSTYKGSVTPILNYTDSQNNTYVGGVRSQLKDSRIVYLGFGLQGIGENNLRDQLVRNIMTWLLTPAGVNDKEEVTPNSNLSLSIAPNPVINSSQVKFNINSTTPTETKLYLIDAAGRKVADLFSGIAASGENQIEFNAANLPSGNYFLIGESNGVSTQLQVNIQK